LCTNGCVERCGSPSGILCNLNSPQYSHTFAYASKTRYIFYRLSFTALIREAILEARIILGCAHHYSMEVMEKKGLVME
jgi:hypothetical protein